MYSEPCFPLRSNMVITSVGIQAPVWSCEKKLGSLSHWSLFRLVSLKSQSLTTTRLMMSPVSESCVYINALPKAPNPRNQGPVQGFSVLVLSGLGSSKLLVPVSSRSSSLILLWVLFATCSHSEIKSAISSIPGSDSSCNLRSFARAAHRSTILH